MFEHLYSNASSLVLVAIFVEALTEIFKKGFPALTVKIPPDAISILFGILHCVVLNIKVFEPASSNPFMLGIVYIFSGFIVSRGSNFLHNLIDLLQKNKPN